MSPMIAKARESRPPAPMPWSARNPASWYIDVDSPQRALPMTNTVMAPRKNGRRP